MKDYIIITWCDDSQLHVLIIVGPPPSPVPLLKITACRSVKFKWDHVFTWPDHPISRYNVIVTDLANNVLFEEETVLNEVNIFLDCFESLALKEVVYSVTAINSIGESNPGNISLRLQDSKFVTIIFVIIFFKRNIHFVINIL